MKTITIIENNHVTGIVYGTVEIGTTVKTIPYKKAITTTKPQPTKATKTKHTNIRSNTYQKPEKKVILSPIGNAIEIRVLYQIKAPAINPDNKYYKKLWKKLNKKRSRKFMFPEDKEVIQEAMAKTHQLRIQQEEAILKQQQIKYAWEQYQK